MIRQIIVTGLLICVLVIGMAAISGCTDKLGRKEKETETELVIPDFPTAKEQFLFARMFQNSQMLAPELAKRRVQMNKVSQYYQRVLKNFPNDPEYVPRTYLELGDCASLSDEDQLAITLYQKAQAISNQDDFIVARSQYSIARMYDIQGRYVEAKQIYKDIMDRYKKSEAGNVRDVVARATKLYLVVQEKK